MIVIINKIQYIDNIILMIKVNIILNNIYITMNINNIISEKDYTLWINCSIRNNLL